MLQINYLNRISRILVWLTLLYKIPTKKSKIKVKFKTKMNIFTKIKYKGKSAIQIKICLHLNKMNKSNTKRKIKFKNFRLINKILILKNTKLIKCTKIKKR
jgi:hypothetical protein